MIYEGEVDSQGKKSGFGILKNKKSIHPHFKVVQIYVEFVYK